MVKQHYDKHTYIYYNDFNHKLIIYMASNTVRMQQTQIIVLKLIRDMKLNFCSIKHFGSFNKFCLRKSI